jgi:hypothetical protein
MILQRTKDTYVGYYDFNVTGGAIGSYDLQVPIPVFYLPFTFTIVVVTPLASAGAATISFDTINTSVFPATTAVGSLLIATAYTSFTGAQNSWYGNLVPTANASGFAKETFAYSIGFSIGTAPLTAGSLQFVLEGVSFDF